MRTMATNNPTYTHLTQFSGLQQLSDLVSSAAKKTADAKTKERQRVATPNSPGRQRVVPHIIEEEYDNAEQKLQQIINRKATKESKPENSNVVRDENL